MSEESDKDFLGMVQRKVLGKFAFVHRTKNGYMVQP